MSEGVEVVVGERHAGDGGILVRGGVEAAIEEGHHGSEEFVGCGSGVEDFGVAQLFVLTEGAEIEELCFGVVAALEHASEHVCDLVLVGGGIVGSGGGGAVEALELDVDASPHVVVEAEKCRGIFFGDADDNVGPVDF